MYFSFPTGIFLSNDLWHNELLKGKRYEFKIWSLPASEIIKTKKVAQLLNELPLPGNRRNASMELRTDSMNHSVQFQSAMKAENLCFKTFQTAEKIVVYVGNADFLKTLKQVRGADGSNETLIIVPLSAGDLVVSGVLSRNQYFAF